MLSFLPSAFNIILVSQSLDKAGDRETGRDMECHFHVMN